MRFHPLPTLALGLCILPPFAFAQNVNTASVTTPAMPPAPAATLPADASNPSVDYAALREQVAQQNKVLTGEVATQRAIVKKNQELLKEAQKLQAANLKLADEKKKLEAQNGELDKQREALKAQQKPAEAN